MTAAKFLPGYCFLQVCFSFRYSRNHRKECGRTVSVFFLILHLVFYIFTAPVLCTPIFVPRPVIRCSIKRNCNQTTKLATALSLSVGLASLTHLDFSSSAHRSCSQASQNTRAMSRQSFTAVPAGRLYEGTYSHKYRVTPTAIPGMVSFQFALREGTKATHVHNKIPLKPLTADFRVSLNSKYKTHRYTGEGGGLQTPLRYGWSA